jgi:hypothetical protein
MTSHFWTRRTLVLAVTIVTLVFIAAAFSVGLAYPEPVSNAALGPDWQCTRLAFVLTTCRKSKRADTATVSELKDPKCPRPIILVQSDGSER